MGRYKYKVEIIFNVDEVTNEIIYYDGQSSYEIGRFDGIVISSKNITVTCERSANRELSKLLTDYNSTVNIQLSKAISFLAATVGNIPKIKHILLKKYDYNGIPIEAKTVTDVLQPIIKQIPSHLFIDSSKLTCLFDGTEKSNMLLIALSFWLKGITEESPGACFEKLWTSFNSLYSYITNEKSEKDKLIQMRYFISNNSTLFSQTSIVLDSYDCNKVRLIQWRNMILNDWETDNEKVMNGFCNFIERYSDCRLNQVFNNILCYREEYLNKYNLLVRTQSSIDKNLALNKKDNIEILCFYVLKYCYFIRNKYFHGERVNPTFQLLKNDNTQEFEQLNLILNVFLKELIESNSSY